MALGAEPLGTNPLACFIYIWPSRELIARSWHWPASWHEAFEHAAGLLGFAAATQVLDGRSFDQEQFELPLHACCVRFSVTHRGESIMIAISDFTGPDTPDPDGGARQPSPVDGLVLGLRGSGRYFRLVVFHGFMPSIPKINELLILGDELTIQIAGDLPASIRSSRSIVPGEIEPMRLYHSGHKTSSSEKSPISSAPRLHVVRGMAHAPPLVIPPPESANHFFGINVDEMNAMEVQDLLCRRSQYRLWRCDKKYLTGYSLQMPESPSEKQRPYLHY